MTAIRIGVLVPAGNTVHEAEFTALRPAGVEFSFRQFVQPAAGTREWCGELRACMAPALADLSAWDARVVLIGCTAASMRCAAPGFVADLERLAGAPIVTAAAASRDACMALGLKSVAVATPYGPANNRIIADYLRSAGIAVAALEGLAYDASPELWKQGTSSLVPERLVDYARTIDVPQAQGMYFPCTGVASLDAIARFEQLAGKPATSSVQAGWWAALRRAGIDGRREGAGRLLAEWPALASG